MEVKFKKQQCWLFSVLNIILKWSDSFQRKNRNSAMLFFAVKCTHFIEVKITALNDKLKTVHFLPSLSPTPAGSKTPPALLPTRNSGRHSSSHMSTLALSTALPGNLSHFCWCKLTTFHVYSKKAQQGAEWALVNISRYRQNKHEREKIPAAGDGT